MHFHSSKYSEWNKTTAVSDFSDQFNTDLSIVTSSNNAITLSLDNFANYFKPNLLLSAFYNSSSLYNVFNNFYMKYYSMNQNILAS